jgi:hypothetical protein
VTTPPPVESADDDVDLRWPVREVQASREERDRDIDAALARRSREPGEPPSSD